MRSRKRLKAALAYLDAYKADAKSLSAAGKATHYTMGACALGAQIEQILRYGA